MSTKSAPDSCASVTPAVASEHVPHRGAEAHQPDHQQQPQIEPIGKEAVDGDRCQLKWPGPQDGAADGRSVPDPQTREAIDAVKRPVIVIAGFAAEAVVLPAAVSALESDYRVQVPVDACGGLSARTEEAAFRQIEAAGGQTTSVVSLVTAVTPDFAQEPGRKAFAALEALRLA